LLLFDIAETVRERQSVCVCVSVACERVYVCWSIYLAWSCSFFRKRERDRGSVGGEREKNRARGRDNHRYGVATISRLLQIRGLFGRILSVL